MGTRADIVQESRSRAHRIKDAEEAKIAATPSETLIDECLDRLIPILTHKRPPSYMSIPVDHERDDDVFVCERLREIKRRLKAAERTAPPTSAELHEKRRETRERYAPKESG